MKQAKAVRKPTQEPASVSRKSSPASRVGGDTQPSAAHVVSFLATQVPKEAALPDAESYVRAIRAAFLEEAHLRARELATEGHRRFPDDPELARYAYVLTPRGVLRADLPPDPTNKLDIQWLREHMEEYRGEWIALKGGQLVAHAPTFSEFKAQLPAVEGLLITWVYG